MDRSSSRKYGVEIGDIKISASDLDDIRGRARQILLDEQGFDVARAWVNATIGHLIKTGVLTKPDSVKNSGETV
jgi:hypothetical protein